MPNGGSDCCGTCWFNNKNNGIAGYYPSDKEGDVMCVIRNLIIPNPFWTYCSNHPHHNPSKIEIPISPVYVDNNGYREIWCNIQDTETIRLELLKLLENIQEKPLLEYPAGNGLDEEIILQISYLSEKRAIPKLKQILYFNPFSEPIDNNPFERNRIITIALSIETYSKLTGNVSLSEIERLIKVGINNKKTNYNPKEDKLSPIRYHAIRGLQYCDDNKAIELLKIGLIDPHDEIKAFSKEILKQKIGEVELNKILDDIQKNVKEKSNWWKFWELNKK